MARNFILLSGGPGIWDSLDPEDHDRSWSNFVDCPLLLSNNGTPPTLPVEADEEIWWFVFKPAYVARWNADKLRTDSAGKAAVKAVEDAGFASYVALIEDRASARGWNLRWLTISGDFWTKLNTFQDPVARVYYWGHARNDLWLSVDHNASHDAIQPPTNQVIAVTDITAHSALAGKFQAGASTRYHRFVGCNTAAFAEKWHSVFHGYTEGIDGKIDFASIHTTGGEPSLSPGAAVKKYDT